MDKLDKILIPALAKKGLAGVAISSLVCFYADKWGKGRFKTISLSKGLLKLSVDSSPAAAELQIEQDKLADFINEKIGKKMVKEIRIVLSR